MMPQTQELCMEAEEVSLSCTWIEHPFSGHAQSGTKWLEPWTSEAPGWSESNENCNHPSHPGHSFYDA